MKSIKRFFDDSESWEVPNMEVPYYFDRRGEINREDTEIPSESKLQSQIEQLTKKIKEIEAKQGVQGLTRVNNNFNANNINNNNNMETSPVVVAMLENLSNKVNMLVQHQKTN